MRKWILLSLLLAMASVGLQAQTQLKGRVLDGSMNNEPLIGASIQVPGTTSGTVSDLDGNFVFQLPEGKFIVQVSMIGYKTKVVNVKGKDFVEVILEEDAKLMDEVVVVGYGTMKKRDLSGSMTQIKGDDLMRGGTTDVAKGMQGKIAGVQVQQTDGSPGAGMSITVRGANSFTTSSEPLYIVDGIPYNNDNPSQIPSSSANENTNQKSNPLSFINPNDIEKIEVLKDASATAIYGSRGANGVVIITTRKGQAGKPKVEFNANFSVSSIVKKIDVLDTETYKRYQDEATANGNYYLGKSDTPSYKDGSADWQDEIYQTGWQQEYSLSVSGGSDKGYYSFSGNYLDQTGTIKESGFNRYGVSLNISRHLTDWLEIGSSSHVSQSITDFQRTSSSDYGIIRSALIFPPTINADSAPDSETDWLAANPAAYIRGARDQLKSINWFSSNYIEAKIMPWLKFRQNIGLGYNDSHRSSFYDKYTQEGKAPTNGKMGRASNIWKSLTLESLLTFDKKFGIHYINAVAGLTFEKGMWDNSSMTATNFPTFAGVNSDIALGLDKGQLTSDYGKQTLESMLARINYTLLDKYIFTASIRTDGSSKFTSENKWATFLSGAFAWRAGEEDFIKDLNIFSNLKLRLSYGETGNQGIGSYRTLTVVEPVNYVFDRITQQGVAMIDWRGRANPDLKWETTGQFNAGLDFGFMDNRLQFTADYYYKKTRDLLQNVSMPYSTGYGQYLTNYGYVTNEGLELTLMYDVLRDGPVKWSINANFSTNKNRIGGLDGDQYATVNWSKADQMFLQRNGCPMGALYGYVEDGYFNSVAEVLSFKEYSGLSEAEALKLVGEVRYRDRNGDGYIDSKDRYIIGDTNPDFVYGITNNLSWKNWNLSFMLQGSQGNDIFNGNLLGMELQNIGNITQDAYDGRWTAENPSAARWPKALSGDSRNLLLSDRYVENGSYLKMKYITLTYDWTRPIKFIERVKFSLTANNVFTITNYSWMDPDVSAFGDASRKGVDMYSYPSARTFTLGVNVVF
ncbi:MAG: TonB-dependent receptor [Prevotella sp.]|nr:TonB-dependent receptor [Prevotella sp.]